MDTVLWELRYVLAFGGLLIGLGVWLDRRWSA